MTSTDERDRSPMVEKRDSVLEHQASNLTPTEALELDRIDPQHDGQISGKTLRDAARRASHLRDSNMFLKKGIFVASVLLLLSWLGNFGLVWVAVNLSKDLKVEGGSLKGSDGSSIRTHDQKNVYTATLATDESRRQLSDGAFVVATVPWEAANLAIVNIQAGETSGVVSFPLCDSSTAMYSMEAAAYDLGGTERATTGINQVFINGDTSLAYNVTCTGAGDDYECDVTVASGSSTVSRRALSFEDAFDGHLDAHAKHTRRLNTKEQQQTSGCSLSVGLELYTSPSPVKLGTAGDFVLLTKAGVTTTGVTQITGDVGTSPIAATAITGFDLTLHSTTTYSTSSLITGNVYAASYTSPTPSQLTTAIGDMQTAYTDAAGRVPPDEVELGAGNIEGMTLTPGLYKWASSVGFQTLTFSGDANATWILQIAQNLNVAAEAGIVLAGGAKAENIVWQVAGATIIETTAAMKGVILCATGIVFKTGSTLMGAALSQTAVTLDAATLVKASCDTACQA